MKWLQRLSRATVVPRRGRPVRFSVRPGPPGRADRGDHRGQHERAVVARTLDDDAGDDRADDPRNVADRVLHPNPGSRCPRPGEHLSDGVQIERQRRRRRARQAEQDADRHGVMREGQAKDGSRSKAGWRPSSSAGTRLPSGPSGSTIREMAVAERAGALDGITERREPGSSHRC